MGGSFGGGSGGAQGTGGTAGVGAAGGGIIVVIYTPSASKPSVTTNAASNVAATSLTLNGNITNTGGANATERGFASSTDSTLSNGSTSTTTESGSFGTGMFTGSMGGLTGNTTYYFRAYATNEGGTGFGAIVSTTTLPAAPGNPAYNNTTATTTGVTWDEPTGGASTYQLNQCSGGSCSLFTGITGNSTTTYSLTGNTTYDYAVRGFNATGPGVFSATTSRLTLPDKPNEPTFTNTTATTTGVTWVEATGGAASYKLTVCQNGTCNLYTNITSNSTTTYGLTGNTTYSFSVRGSNATGDGLLSATSTRLTVPGIPEAPTFENITETTVTVNWGAPTDGASTYDLERCAGSGCTDFVVVDNDSADTTHADSNLTASTLYRYRVRATNATGDGLYSNIGEMTTSAEESQVARVIRLRGGTRLLPGIRLTP